MLARLIVLGAGTALFALAAASGCGDSFVSTGTGTPSGSGGAGTTTTSSTAGGTGGGSAGSGGVGQGGGGGETPRPACRALHFDGVDDFVQVPAHASLEALGAFTIEAWVDIESSSLSGVIVSNHKFDAGQATGTGWLFAHETSRALTLQLLGTTGIIGIGGSPDEQIDAQTWSHVAAVNSGSQLALFIDGLLMGEVSVEAGVFTASGGRLRIGISADSLLQPFHGTIDDVRLSTGVRYAGTFSPPSQRFDVDSYTVALWHFDEPSGETVLDAAGEHDGVLGQQDGPEIYDPQRVDVPCIGDLR